MVKFARYKSIIAIFLIFAVLPSMSHMAHATPVLKNQIEPIGFNLVKGKPDVKNPIVIRGLTKDPGYSTTSAFPGSLPVSSVTTEEKVIKRDDRTRILDTLDMPYRWLGTVDFSTPQGENGTCTGALVSRDIVLTAGHCVAHKNEITFTPGKNRDKEPFGTVDVAQVWYDVNLGNDGHDWAVIRLSSPIGDKIGWFGMKIPDSAALHGGSATIVGYPSDKLESTLWGNKDVITHVNEKQVFYVTDTFRGQSGAPVLDDDAMIFAIHTSGDDHHNWGTLLTSALFSVIVNLSKS